jgi:hypothetical protein
MSNGQHEYLERVNKIIDESGWMVQGVVAAKTAPGPTFAYTVGLTPHGFPELITAGPPVRTAKEVLNQLARRVFDRNERFTDGQVIPEVLSGFDAVIVEGSYGRDHLWPATALALYEAEYQVRLQQVVWPDPDGRFPWDEGYSMPPQAQPLLRRPHTRGKR